MVDSLEEHLQRYGLLDLHNEAEKVGYRVRVANDWIFECEYQAGLPKYCQQGLAIRTFDNTDEGKAKARAFFAEVQVDIDAFKTERGEVL